ncbi:MAG TPA: DcaP family trimeric outer membrane transporter [Bacteroidales bacterium]|nr:DcaP family trimeric outer membrane transporter [Bacteroidales bacterium]
MKKHFFLIMLFCSLYSLTYSQEQKDSTKWIQIYGFAMTDFGYNFNQVDPKWYDVMRPSKLPAYDNQFGTDGNFYFSARQSRFGVKSSMQTKWGEFKTVFDFDLFGVGADAGLTTIRLRHAYGQLGHIGAGQTESAFMDLDVFPNTLEYWGPSGMLFYRNVQFRYYPIMGPTHLVFALEMPGASADGGTYADRIELSYVKPHFPYPDLSGHFRYAGKKWGYVQLGAIVRYIGWKYLPPDVDSLKKIDLSGHAIGWGVSLSSGINIGKVAVIHLQAVYGAGVENYFNDAPLDIGIKENLSDSVHPIKGVALPDLGLVAFVDLYWSKKFSSSIGWSNTTIMNSDGQAPSDYHLGHFVEANLLYYPWHNVMVGVEFQWIYRQNNSDGYTSQATKINFSLKYNFDKTFYFAKK